MLRSLYSAASGMTAQQMNVDNIANNLANANTTGFKMRRAHFQDLLYQNMTQAGAAAGAQTTIPAGLQLGLGTRASSNDTVFTQGNLTKTDNPLDIAIQGSGFFQIRLQNGSFAYTRDGSFKLDRDGNVVTAEGDLLEPSIKIPADAQSITIATAATEQVGNEGVIFRFVAWHSVALCAIVGIIVMLYAYVFPGAVPHGLTFVK